MLKRFITILSILILSISSTYCYNKDNYYDTFCYNFTNANNELIPYKNCASQYGKGYYCCETCTNRTCCNDTGQFLEQKFCDNMSIGLVYLVYVLPIMICTCCCFIFCHFDCFIYVHRSDCDKCSKQCFRLIRKILIKCFKMCFAKREGNPMQNSDTDQAPSRISSARRISSQRLNSIQFDILPTYDMVINYHPNLPSYDMVINHDPNLPLYESIV